MDPGLRRRFEADHQVKEGGLSATSLADNCYHLAWGNGQVEALDCDYGLSRCGLPEDLAQATHLDGRRAAHTRHRNTRVSTRATIASSRNSRATSTNVQANTSATENNSCATDNLCPMPVTAPTNSAMVTTRIAKLILTFQLVKIVGTIAGSISLKKYCQVVGRKDRII